MVKITTKDMNEINKIIKKLTECMEHEVFDKILERAEIADEKDETNGVDELYQEVRDMLEEYQDNLQNTIDNLEQIYSELS